jgi:hypothetical protein
MQRLISRLTSPVVAVSLVALAVLTTLAPPAAALVHYDTGQRTVLGVQLLQDADDPSVYYYLAPLPRLAVRDDGTYELLCLKYVGSDGTSGGLFHALVEMGLPEEAVRRLEQELQKDLPGARLAGPVPLIPVSDDAGAGNGSFTIVSAVLNPQADEGFESSVVTSGVAPVTPGSKAAVAALLNPQAATLLWDSFTGPTSDVSVAVNAYYEAKVKGYNARVHADVENVYQHFSRVSSFQQDYTKRQLRKVVDEMQQAGTLEIEVFDRSEGLGLDAEELEAVLSLVTDKLTELMFDSQAGWAKEPTREAAVEPGQLAGRQERGWFWGVFGDSQDAKYYTDNQYVLKRRQDIRRSSFDLNLTKSSTIQVPVSTAGNLGGIWDELGDDPRYFRIVALDDPDFEFRNVHFQVDGKYVDSFADTINFVSVNVRKTYPDRPAYTEALQFTHDRIQEGGTTQEIAFPRLGQEGEDWAEYEYQVRWSVHDGPTLSIPPQEDRWLDSGDAAVSLVPPFTKRTVEIDADRRLFTDAGVASAVIEFAVILAGEPRVQRAVTLRPGDSDPVTSFPLYHDRDEPVAYRVSWYSPRGVRKGRLQVLDGDYLYLVPPQEFFEREEEEGEDDAEGDESDGDDGEGDTP